MSPGDWIYKALNVVCAVDVTHVLLLDARKSMDLSPPLGQATRYECHCLAPDELRAQKPTDWIHFSESFIDDVKTMAIRWIVCQVQGDIVGHCFLETGQIPARHNTAGLPFRGIALRLPPGTHYLFKVAVSPEYRGKRVVDAMIAHALQMRAKNGLQAIVTTTDWSNQAFLRSSGRLGFKRCGYTVECRLLGQHLFKLPRPFDASTGQPLSRGSYAGNDLIELYDEFGENHES